jgi:hypothetical protein
LVRRLQISLGVLVATTLCGLVAIVVSEQRVATALERSETALSLLDEFKEVQIQLSTARAAEREFVLEDLRAPNFFNTGDSPALAQHARALDALDGLLSRLVDHPAAETLHAREIREAVAAYGGNFRELVSLYRERGSPYTGVLGQMREATFDFQDRLEQGGKESALALRSELLELLRDRDQYLRDLDHRPRFIVDQRIEVLAEDVDALGHPQAEQLHAAIDAIAKAWARLIEIDDRIGRSSGAGLRGELRGAQEIVVPLTTAAVERARTDFEQSRRQVVAATAMARGVSAGAVSLAVAIATWLAISLGGHLRRSLRAVLDAVEAYAEGDRSARVGPLSLQDEFAVLGGAFDRMAETLAETTEELEEVNASLKLAVKGDTAGLVERIQALVAKRKPAHPDDLSR